MEPWLKYPSTVYTSVQIDTVGHRQCSDLATDYQLCTNGYNFMEEPENDYKFKPKYNLPEDNFEISSISDGTRFYKAKKTGSCGILKKYLLTCSNSVREERHYLQSLHNQIQINSLI